MHEGPLLCTLYGSLKSVTRGYICVDIDPVFNEGKERLRRTHRVSADEFHIEVGFFPYLGIRETACNNSGEDIGILLNLFDKQIHGFAILFFDNVLGLHGVLLFRHNWKSNFGLKIGIFLLLIILQTC